MANRFDELLTRLGTGRWNFLTGAAMLYWSAQVPYQTLGGPFYAPALDVECRIPEGGFPKLLNPEQDSGNLSIYSSCEYQVETSDGRLEDRSCTEWDYDNSTFISTLTSEFNLVCGYKFMRATFQSMYQIGLLVGAAGNGFLSDRFGRKRMFAVGTSIYIILSLILVFLPQLSLIMAARFIIGIMHPTANHSGYTLVMEMTELKYRTAVGLCIFILWPLGTIAWGGYAYLIREWRWLQLTVTLPAFLFFPFLWFIDESPRWLIVSGRHDDALKVLQKAARWNKAHLPPPLELRSIMMDITQEERKLEGTSRVDTRKGGGIRQRLRELLESVLILIRTRRIRAITLSMYTIFLVSGLVFYGIALSGENFSTNPFVYMSLGGAMDLPSHVITIPIAQYLGRRKSNVIYFLSVAAALLTIPFVPQALNWLAVTLNMIGKLSIGCAYGTIFLHACEAFPTEVRIRGLGTSTMLSQIGSAAAPFIVDFMGSIRQWAPSVVFGISAVFASAISLTLPETLGKELPDTVAELETKHSPGERSPPEILELRGVSTPEEESRD